MAGYELDEKAPHVKQAAERPQGMGQINEPVPCEICGSTWFYTIHSEQFTGGGYGSVEMRSITGNPVQMRICLCGNPIVPQAQNFGGSKALGTRQSFYMSAKAAKEYRSSHSLDHVAEIAASPAELKKIQEQVNELKDIIRQLGDLKDLVKQMEELKLKISELTKSKKVTPKKAAAVTEAI